VILDHPSKAMLSSGLNGTFQKLRADIREYRCAS
jgi:hypothetical protein